MNNKQLILIREQMKLNQIQFAKLLGLKRQATISDYERGFRKIPLPIQILIKHIHKPSK